MYAVFGLGNPDKEYDKTRHNIGFDVIDELASQMGVAIEEDLNTRFADVDRKQLRLGAAGTFQKQEDADQWYKMVKDTFENEIDDIYYDSLSFSLGCHVGPNAIGIGISVVTRDEK